MIKVTAETFKIESKIVHIPKKQIPIKSLMIVYGLAKETVNGSANVNEVKDLGGYGIFGSGKITACIFGVYEVKNFNYTTSDGTPVEFKAIASLTDASMVPGAILGSDASGCIAAVAADATSAFGSLIAVNEDTIQVKIGF